MRLPASISAELPSWPPLLATRGPGAASSPHAHHAMHLVVCARGELRVRAGARGRWRAAAGVVTAPDVPHEIDARGEEILLVFLDPESAAGAALAAALGGPLRLVTAAERAALGVEATDPIALMRRDPEEWVARLLGVLGVTPAPRRSTHPRVRAVLRRLRSRSAEDEVSLASLAADVGLSPGRLMHAFTESIGIPLRPYLSWLRLQRAAASIVAGVPLATAAAAAGFSDAAHMSRTFRRMFGMAPSQIARP
jgi:transcriptional regulator GlxA family with amidase domain